MRRLLVSAALLVAMPAGAAPMFVPLGLLPGATTSVADGVSADGSTVAGDSYGSSSDEAFRWTQTAGIQGLGVLPGATHSYSSGVSADGSTVVGDSYNPDGSLAEAFRWTQTAGIQGLGVLPGATHSYSSGVSADGSTVVGGSYGDSFNEAFRWTQTGGIQGLGVLPGATDSYANGVSADGSTVVGESYGSSSDEAFRWTQTGGIQGLGVLQGATSSAASGVSADGSTIAGSSWGDSFGGDSFAEQAFRWTQAGGLQALGVLPGATNSYAYGVSADGSTVVGESYGDSFNETAFRWTQAGGIQSIGLLPGATYSYVHGVSADGSTIVGACGGDSIGSDRAFVWDPINGTRELNQVLTSLGLNLTGWNLLEAIDISSDGRTIAGNGKSPNGSNEAWLATIPDPNGPACDNGLDDDGDGLIDLSDPGCSDGADLSENAPTLPCDDGADNDGDGKTDFLADGSGDPGCWSPIAITERPQCQDGLNNDGAIGIDFDGGDSLDINPRDGLIDVEFNPNTPAVGAADPDCVGNPSKNRERPGYCGLGFELVFLTPLLARLTRTRRRRA